MILALIYQTSVETETGSGVKIILLQSRPEVHERCIWTVPAYKWVVPMKVLVENNPHLNMMPPFIHCFACLTSALYNMQVRNMAARNFSKDIPGKLVPKLENYIFVFGSLKKWDQCFTLITVLLLFSCFFSLLLGRKRARVRVRVFRGEGCDSSGHTIARAQVSLLIY